MDAGAARYKPAIVDRSVVILFSTVDISTKICIIQDMTTKKESEIMTEIVNTLVSQKFLETILGECESIISEVENVYHSVTDDDMLNVIQFNDIRESAEELQTKVLDFAEESDEYQTKCLLDEIVENSITLYQNVKYILEHCENEIFSSTDTEIFECFDYMRTSVTTIRDEIDTLVLKLKD